MPDDDKKGRRRSDYPFFQSYRTRWSDNDQYAHVNNAVYYHFFDGVINSYLIAHCGLDPAAPESEGHIGLVVASSCEFFAPLSFPDVLDLGLRVAHLGTRSVTYEVGVFSTGEERPAAVGGYTHVFVGRRTRTSVPIHAQTRAGLERLVTAARPKL